MSEGPASSPPNIPASPLSRELVDVLWAYGRLRQLPCAELRSGLLEPLLQRGVPLSLGQASSVELAKFAAAFSMMRWKDRWVSA
jgi:hypothetical protein